MVHALNRARQWLRPDGCLIDLHPGEAPALVEVSTPGGNVRVGDVQDDSDAKGPLGRHRAADLALEAAIATQGWILQQRATFTFASEADTVDELDDHLRQKWRAARLDAGTREGANALLRANPGAIARIIEQVTITRMRTLDPPRRSG
jgi:hypothetical protein